MLVLAGAGGPLQPAASPSPRKWSASCQPCCRSAVTSIISVSLLLLLSSSPSAAHRGGVLLPELGGLGAQLPGGHRGAVPRPAGGHPRAGAGALAGRGRAARAQVRAVNEHLRSFTMPEVEGPHRLLLV